MNDCGHHMKKDEANMHPAFPFTDKVDAVFLGQLRGDPTLKGTRRIDAARTIGAGDIRTHAARNELPQELTQSWNRNMPEPLPAATIVLV